MEIILAEVGQVRVTAVEPDPKSFACTVACDGALPEDFKKYTVFDTTACPALEFLNCSAPVENCVFEGCTGTAIHIGAEGDRMECPASAAVVVRNNRCSDIPQEPVVVRDSRRVTVRNNLGAPDTVVP